MVVFQEVHAKYKRSCMVGWIKFSRRKHDNIYLEIRSQIYVHTDERTQIRSARSSLVVTHPSTNPARRAEL